MSSSSAHLSCLCLAIRPSDTEKTLRMLKCCKCKVNLAMFNRTHVTRVDISPTRTARMFWLATMLFCSHAVKTTVTTLLNLKVSGFNCPHVSEKIMDSKVSGFTGQIHRMLEDERRRIQKEKYMDSKVSGYVWARPKNIFDYLFINISLCQTPFLRKSGLIFTLPSPSSFSSLWALLSHLWIMGN